MTTLHYIGNGAYRPDLPQRDIDAAELAVLAKRKGIEPEELAADALGSGLYSGAAGVNEPVDAFADAKSGDKPLDEMSREELRAAAKDLGLGQGGSKAELLERLRGAIAEAPQPAAATPEAPEA
jgi:hypothetical protein